MFLSNSGGLCWQVSTADHAVVTCSHYPTLSHLVLQGFQTYLTFGFRRVAGSWLSIALP